MIEMKSLHVADFRIGRGDNSHRSFTSCASAPCSLRERCSKRSRQPLQGSHQDTVRIASIDKQASRIARASFAVAPIIPPLPRGFIRNQNQALSRLQITKSTPKWRLRVDETTLTARTSSIHLLTPSSRFRETRRVLDTYRSEFAAEQRWVTYGILKRGPSPHFREIYDTAVVFLYDGQTSRAPFWR